MESTNLHQLQDQLPPVIFHTSLSNPSCYGTGSSHSWSPEISFNRNAGNLNQLLQEAAASRSRDSTQKKDIGMPPLNDSMIEDLGYHWASDAESCLSSNQSTHDSDQQFCIKKEEISNTFPKFTASNREHYRWFPAPTTHMKDALSEKLMLKPLSSGHFYSSSTVDGLGIPSRGNFSQIYPSINISNLNQSSAAASSTSLNMNMRSSYLLNSGDSSLPSQDGRQSLSLLLDHMQHPVYRSSNNSCTYPSHFPNGMVEIKRASALVESKASESQTASKKLRLESRPSCPPLKVRKEKLGDRIAALQQLVAPFGKTDTASVLMEAVGYIKFLHSQVETLSVPYMKSSRNQNKRVMQGGSAEDDTGQESKQDLRSRGLRLVPLSCLSYIDNR